jgi:hypothetical protein
MIEDLNCVRTDCYKNLSLSRVANVKGYRTVIYSRHTNDQDEGVFPYDCTYYGSWRPITVDTSLMVPNFFKGCTMRPIMEVS